MDVEPLQLTINSKGAQADLNALAKALDHAGAAYGNMEQKVSSASGGIDAALKKNMATMERAAKIAQLLGQVRINSSGAAGLREFASAINALGNAKGVSPEKINTLRNFFQVLGTVRAPGGGAAIVNFLREISTIRTPTMSQVNRLREFFMAIASFRAPGNFGNVAQLLHSLNGIRVPSEVAIKRLQSLFVVLSEAKGVTNSLAVATSLNRIADSAGRASAAFATLPPRMRSVSAQAEVSSGRIKGLGNAFDFLGHRMQFGYQVGTLFTTLFNAFTLGAFIHSVVDASNRAMALQKALLFMTGSVEKSAQGFAEFNKMAFDLGVNIKDIQEPFARFLMSAKEAGLTLKQSHDAFEGVALGLRVIGASAEQSTGAVYALQEMLAKGKVTSKEFTRQLAQYIPGAAAFGAEALSQMNGGQLTSISAFYKQMKAGTIDSAKFVPLFGAQVEKAMAPLKELSKERPDAALNNLHNAWTMFAQGVGRSDFITAMNNGLNNFTKTIVDTDGKLTPTFQRLANSLGSGAGEIVAGLTSALSYLTQHIDAVILVMKVFMALKLTQTLVGWGEGIAKTAATLSTWATKLGLVRAAEEETTVATVADTEATNLNTAAKLANARANQSAATASVFGRRGRAASTTAEVGADGIRGTEAAMAMRGRMASRGLGGISNAIKGMLGLETAAAGAAAAEGAAAAGAAEAAPALLAMGPPGWVAAGALAAAAASVFLFGNSLTTLGDHTVRYKDVVGGIAELVGSKFAQLGSTIGRFFSPLSKMWDTTFGKWSLDLPSFGDILANVAAAVVTFSETVIKAFGDAAGAIVSLVEGKPGQALDKLLAGVNQIIHMGQTQQANVNAIATSAAKRSAAGGPAPGAGAAARLNDDMFNEASARLAEPSIQANNEESDARIDTAKQFGMDTGAASAGTLSMLSMVKRTSQATGFDAQVLKNIVAFESHGSGSAKNPISSASGIIQMTDAQWLGALKQFGAKFGAEKEASVVTGSPGHYSVDTKGLDKAQAKARVEFIMGLRNLDSQLALNLQAQSILTDVGQMKLNPQLAGLQATGGVLYADQLMGAPQAKKFLIAQRQNGKQIAANLFPTEAASNKNLFMPGGQKQTLDQVMANFNRIATGKNVLDEANQDAEKLQKTFDEAQNKYEQYLGKGSPQEEAQNKYDEAQRVLKVGGEADLASRSQVLQGGKAFYDKDKSAEELKRQAGLLQDALHPLRAWNDDQAEAAKIDALRARGLTDEATVQTEINKLLKEHNVLGANEIATEKDRYLAMMAGKRADDARIDVLNARNAAQLALIKSTGTLHDYEVSQELLARYKGMGLDEARARAGKEGVLPILGQKADINDAARTQTATVDLQSQVTEALQQSRMNAFDRAFRDSYKSALEKLTGETGATLDKLTHDATQAQRDIATGFAKQMQEIQNPPGFQKWADGLEPFSKKLEDIKAGFAEGLSSTITEALTGGKADWKGLMRNTLKEITKAQVDQQLKGVMQAFGIVSPQSPEQQQAAAAQQMTGATTSFGGYVQQFGSVVSSMAQALGIQGSGASASGVIAGMPSSSAISADSAASPAAYIGAANDNGLTGPISLPQLNTALPDVSYAGSSSASAGGGFGNLLMNVGHGLFGPFGGYQNAAAVAAQRGQGSFGSQVYRNLGGQPGGFLGGLFGAQGAGAGNAATAAGLPPTGVMGMTLPGMLGGLFNGGLANVGDSLVGDKGLLGGIFGNQGALGGITGSKGLLGAVGGLGGILDDAAMFGLSKLFKPKDPYQPGKATNGVIGQYSTNTINATQVAGHANIIGSLLNMAIAQKGPMGFLQQGMGALGQIGSGVGSMFSQGLGFLAGLFSEGGYTHSPVSRTFVPASAFASAPHFSGGGRTDGIPAIVHPDEAVVPLSGGRAIPVEGMQSPSYTHVTTNMNVYSPNPDAFRQSRGSIQRQLNRDTRRAAVRNLNVVSSS